MGSRNRVRGRDLKNISVTGITISENQPRQYFDEYELLRLRDSIKQSGIIQPLTVRKKENGKYELLAGERRLRAAILAGYKKVPCIVYCTDDISSAVFSLTENLQRSDLTFFEEAEGINRLITHFGLTHYEAAAELGLAQSTLSNKLRVLCLNEKQRERIVSARLTERHARALVRLEEKQRDEALDFIIGEALTVAQTETYIENLLRPQEKPVKAEEKPREFKNAIGDIRLFANSFSRLVTTLTSSGIRASEECRETKDYIEYRVKINKCSVSDQKATQLKIC